MTGKELRRKRERCGLSMRALARRAELHHRTIAYWEGKAALDPLSPAVAAICAALEWRITAQPIRARVMGSYTAKEPVLTYNNVVNLIGARLAGHLFFARVPCRATTRAGKPCRAQSEPGRKRCRFHGGLSTGPRTEEGRKRIAEAQRRRWREWRQRNGTETQTAVKMGDGGETDF